MTTSTRHTIRFSQRVRDMQVSPTAAVLNRAQELLAQGIDVVDFGPGEPDFRTPKSIAEAGKRAIDQGQTKYTSAYGTLALRDAIADRYNGKYGTHIGPKNIIAGTGGKQELFNITLSLVDAGDEVIIPSPYWVSFPDQVAFAGGKPVFAKSDPENGFRPTLADITAVATARTRGVILNSPNNPTGAVILAEELERIVRWCAEHGLFLLFDETYEFFIYEGRHHASAMRSFDQFPETVITVNSMSKTYAMTGWRLGFAIGHPDVIAAAARIQSHSTTNASSIAQAAAVEALRGNDDDIHRMFEAYNQRRAWLVPALNTIEGFDCPQPDGAFYVFPNVKALYGRGPVRDSTSFANYLVEEARVAVVPGTAFGNDDCIRISYATSMERIREGVARIKAAVEKL